MRLVVSLLALLLAAPAPAHAAETRTAPEGHTPPPATVGQLDWLVGMWAGEGIGGTPATEVYSPPGAGSLAGHFVQQDGEGGVEFFEIMQIAEVGGSLVYRLKHFTGELVGWEEKDKYVSFPLVAIEPNAVYFSGLTLRREGDALISAVLVRQTDGSVQEYVFRYRLRDTGEAATCPGAISTVEMNACFSARYERAEQRLGQYFAAALKRHSDAPGVVTRLEASQNAFVTYREQECGAVYEQWREGTIRTVMGLGCRLSLTDERTHQLWQSWLTYMDSTPPVLSEPGPTP